METQEPDKMWAALENVQHDEPGEWLRNTLFQIKSAALTDNTLDFSLQRGILCGLLVCNRDYLLGRFLVNAAEAQALEVVAAVTDMIYNKRNQLLGKIYNHAVYSNGRDEASGRFL